MMEVAVVMVADLSVLEIGEVPCQDVDSQSQPLDTADQYNIEQLIAVFVNIADFC